jgi:acyl carrier protein
MSDEVLLREIVGEYGEVLDDGTLVLDSHGVVSVVVAIEDRLGIRLSARSVRRERFASITTLVELVGEARGLAR